MSIKWNPIDDAPTSTPLDQVCFLAYCPDDDWGPLGNIHVAVRYPHFPAGMVRPNGSIRDRPATHFAIPEPPTP